MPRREVTDIKDVVPINALTDAKATADLVTQ